MGKAPDNGMATTPDTVLRLGHMDAYGDSSGSQGAVVEKRNKRPREAPETDKSGPGLREISMKVCKKVESKGRTTYNEVADELVAEYAEANNALSNGQKESDWKNKNIFRRVYDALNVLMAMDIISKDKKEVLWKGLPQTRLDDIEKLKCERLRMRNKIEKKAAYLQELDEHFVGYQNLALRNQQSYNDGNVPTGGVALPFILVQTKPNATVEVEISENMQLVHFDFDRTPFELHDDHYVLKQMKICDKSQVDGGDCNSLGNAAEDPSVPYTHFS